MRYGDADMTTSAGCTVLLIEPDPHWRLEVSESLRADGVICAEGASFEIDAVIVDRIATQFVMIAPEADGEGLELLKQLDRRRPSIPVVVLASDSSQEQLRSAYRCILEVYRKPLDLDVLAPSSGDAAPARETQTLRPAREGPGALRRPSGRLRRFEDFVKCVQEGLKVDWLRQDRRDAFRYFALPGNHDGHHPLERVRFAQAQDEVDARPIGKHLVDDQNVPADLTQQPLSVRDGCGARREEPALSERFDEQFTEFCVVLDDQD